MREGHHTRILVSTPLPTFHSSVKCFLFASSTLITPRDEQFFVYQLLVCVEKFLVNWLNSDTSVKCAMCSLGCASRPVITDSRAIMCNVTLVNQPVPILQQAMINLATDSCLDATHSIQNGWSVMDWR